MVDEPKGGIKYYILDGSEMLRVEVKERRGDVYLVRTDNDRHFFMIEKHELFNTIDEVFDICNNMIKERNRLYSKYRDNGKE